MNPRLLLLVTGLAALLPSLLLAQPIPYTTVAGDVTGTRTYTLPNGLRVYVSVNTEKPRIQTFIAVRAGSKNDPPEATGLAHYLEHMLFKGTSSVGTLNYEKERPYLERIADMFEEYRGMKDTAQRRAFYHQIDSLSGIAATYAIANEYDKVVQSLGCSGTNAFTSQEMTAYVNDVPSNRLKTFLQLEGERFRQCVLRLFHTELEAVYEEKNISLDEDVSLTEDTLMRALFPEHTYGTQSTLGTVEHLKNPSMRRIQEFFTRHYVPKNMAIVLVGDLDPDSAVAWVQASFGQYPSPPVPYFGVREQPTITQPIVKNVVGTDPEFVTMAYRLPGATHHDLYALRMCDMILANSTAGLIDLNLRQRQVVREPYSTLNVMADFSMEQLGGSPMPGESLEDVTKHLLDQIELLKNGAFDEKLMKSVVLEYRISNMRRAMTNEGRAYTILNAFALGVPLNVALTETDSLAAVTKAEVIRAARTYFKNNYVVVYKREGERQDIQKITKPEITPVPMNRDAVSPFARSIMQAPAATVAPKFVDLQADLQRGSIRSDIPLLAVRNTENQLFELRYYIHRGSLHDRNLEMALDLLSVLGTAKLDNTALQQRKYALGMQFSAQVAQDHCTITVSGIQEKFAACVQLMEEILKTCKGTEDDLADSKRRWLKEREDARKDKSTIFYQGMMNYARYGPRNSFRSGLSSSEIQALTLPQLTTVVHELLSTPHEVHYWGPLDASAVAKALRPLHNVPARLTPPPTATPYVVRTMDAPEVLFLDYDMVTADVMFTARSFPAYDTTLGPRIRLFNEYFDGGMGSIVFQTVREQKALAYSTGGGLSTPYLPGEPYTVATYIGTQADKLHDAITTMKDLLTTLPRVDGAVAASKEAIRSRLATERTLRMGIIDLAVTARRFGFHTDQRAYTWSVLPTLSFDQIKDAFAKGVANRPYTLVVMGSKDKIDMKMLEQFGPVRTLTLDDVFPK